jgi:transposase
LTEQTTYKPAPAQAGERPDVAAAREQWRQDQPGLDPARLVFIDETGTSTKMIRRRGRARRGTRLIGRVLHGHWKITTFVAGLRCGEMAAPFVIDRPMNSAIFLHYVTRCLAPALKPGDIVVMDNRKPHNAAGVREAIEAAGAKLLYLPPYSPDLHPIEQVIAKPKALLRKAAERSIGGLGTASEPPSANSRRSNAAAYLRHAGYGAT